MPAPISRILETCLYVDDLPVAQDFYSQIPGIELYSTQDGRHVFFRCGGQMLLLFNPQVSRQSNDTFPAHGSFGPGHVAFAVPEASLDDWTSWLSQRQIAIEKTIDWPGGGRSLYFRDPAGNSLELATPKIWKLPESST